MRPPGLIRENRDVYGLSMQPVIEQNELLLLAIIEALDLTGSSV